MMTYAGGHVFFEDSRTLAGVYHPGDDPRPLQLAFARLFDEAAQAISRAGSDLDEVLVERLFLVRVDGKEHEVPANFLSDAALVQKSVLAHFAANDRSNEAKGLEIFAVKIIARYDELRQTSH